MKEKRFVVYLAAVAAMLFWAASYVWYKQAFEMFKPITIIFLRLLLSYVLLSLFLHFSKISTRIDKKDYKLFLLLAFFEPFCYFMGESHGMQHVSATLGSIIISTIPLFTPLMTFIFLRERIVLIHIVSIFISFAGVFLIVSGGTIDYESVKGIALMLFAVLAGTGYGIIVRVLAVKYSSLVIVRAQNIIGIFFFLPFLYLREWDAIQTLQFNTTSVLAVVQLSIFGSTLAFIFMTIAIHRIGLINATIFTNLIPVFTAVIAFFVIDEPLTVRVIGGIMIVILGLFLSQLPYYLKWKKKRQMAMYGGISKESDRLS
jgi:drug/metabolite transporter (DMT)-like permease